MTPFAPASFLEVIDRIMSVVGTAATILVGVFGAYLAIKKFRQSKIQKELQDDKEVLNRFAAIEKTVETLSTNYEHLRNDVLRSRVDLEEHIDKLANNIATVQSNCVQHNQSYELADLRKDVDRLSQSVDRLNRELTDHRENVSNRYLTVSSYQGDMQMLSQTFTAFQQSLRDLQFMLNRGASP